jgi:hypothetical protein
MKRLRTILAQAPFPSLGSAVARHAGTGLLAASVAAAPLPVLAGAPAETEETAPAEAAEVGGVVALLRLDGDADGASEMRELLQTVLYENGYDVKGVKRSGDEAAKKNKCDISEDTCLSKIGAYLNKNARTPFDFFVTGTVPGDGGAGEIITYDIKNDTVVKRVGFTRSLSDAILPVTLPSAVGNAMARHQVPRGEITQDEKALLAALDEPEKTPEEVAAEQKRLEDAERQGLQAYNASFDAGEQEVDLKKDFEQFCRTGPREDEITVDMNGEEQVERDMRPVCKRGPAFGYWQPKAFAVLSMTLISAAAMGTMYGLALGARGTWSKAKDELDASGLSPDPLSGDAEGYQALALPVSEAAAKIRRRAIVGDALLGTTALLGGLLTIIIFQERGQAKDYLQTQKELQITNLRVAPIVGAGAGGQGGTYGAAAGFSF